MREGAPVAAALICLACGVAVGITIYGISNTTRREAEKAELKAAQADLRRYQSQCATLLSGGTIPLKISAGSAPALAPWITGACVIVNASGGLVWTTCPSKVHLNISGEIQRRQR